MPALRIKTVIVDDEPLARERISQLLSKESNVEIAAECGDGLAALTEINKYQPDLIFLDVQMPEVSGFDVLHELDVETMPAVIFVTAFDQYTIQAFDADAVDYLLKPFSEERFRQALSRARQHLRPKSENDYRQRLSRLLDRFNLNKGFLERLIVSHKNRLILVPLNDVDWIESYGNYLKIHAGDKTYLLRQTMNELAARMSPEKFIRIHRATLVNIERIKEFQPMFGGLYTVVLRDGTELTLSRNYRKSVLGKFEV
jgi:two-component system LytT family response regulator